VLTFYFFSTTKNYFASSVFLGLLLGVLAFTSVFFLLAFATGLSSSFAAGAAFLAGSAISSLDDSPLVKASYVVGFAKGRLPIRRSRSLWKIISFFNNSFASISNSSFFWLSNSLERLYCVSISSLTSWSIVCAVASE